MLSLHNKLTNNKMSTNRTKIAILGATGRTGSHILKHALNHPKFEVVGGLGRDETSSECDFKISNNLHDVIKDAEIIIDFSQPDVTMDALGALGNRKIIIGTTAFNDSQDKKIIQTAADHIIFKAANMSLGINIISEFIKKYHSLINQEFESVIHDIHHKHKKDAPSGTGLMLKHSFGEQSSVVVHSSRVSEVKGIHEISLFNEQETLSIKHEITDRAIFAINSLKIAMWLSTIEKAGLYNMSNFLNQNHHE